MKHLKSINEISEISDANRFGLISKEDVINDYKEKFKSDFYDKFLEYYPTYTDWNNDLLEEVYKDIPDEDTLEGLTNIEILDKYWSGEAEMYLIDKVGKLPEFDHVNGIDPWMEFYYELCETDWNDTGKKTF